MQGGCRLRTFWQENAAALFIPAVESGSCEKGGWLSGRTVITQSVNGKEKQSTVTFVHGFPVLGLNAAADPNKLLITAVNNQRMVVSNENAQQSWMILPYVAGQNGWQMTGTLAIEMSQELANDPSRLQARIEAARSVWTPWLAPDIKLNVVLIDGLHPLLRNPAPRMARGKLRSDDEHAISTAGWRKRRRGAAAPGKRRSKAVPPMPIYVRRSSSFYV